jgi:hypothetical protein
MVNQLLFTIMAHISFAAVNATQDSPVLYAKISPSHYGVKNASQYQTAQVWVKFAIWTEINVYVILAKDLFKIHFNHQ